MSLTSSGAPIDRADEGRSGSVDDWNEHWEGYANSNRLNPSQVYRRKLVFQLLALDAAAAPVRLIDIGSGSGAFAADVVRASPGAEVVGLEGSASGVAISRKNVPGARFFQADLNEPMPLEPGYERWATHAVCSEVLEHLDDPVLALRNVRPLLAPGCKLVVTVPAGPMSAFDKHIGHRAHFRPERLRSTLEGAGLEVVDVLGAGFPFFNLYRLAVVARGESLIHDAAHPDGRNLSLVARSSIRVFSWLFKLNTTRTNLGWQLVALAREPGSPP